MGVYVIIKCSIDLHRLSGDEDDYLKRRSALQRGIGGGVGLLLLAAWIYYSRIVLWPPQY